MTDIERSITYANMAAWREYATDVDAPMPDVINYADVAAARHRIPNGSRALNQIAEAAWTNPAGVRWATPKLDGSARLMVLPNPYFEIYLRRLVHDEAEQLVAAQSSHAYASRFEFSTPPRANCPVLRVASFGEMHADYRQDLDAIIDGGHLYARIADIRAFYPSLTPTTIERELRRLGISATVAAALAHAAAQLATDARVDGLPIRMELAGLVANLMLSGTDSTLDHIRHLDWTRWGDDFVLADGSPTVVNLGTTRLIYSIAEHGLELSPNKMRDNFTSCETVEEVIRTSAASQGDIGKAISFRDPAQAEQLLLNELSKQQPMPSRLRRLFGELAKTPANDHTISEEILDVMLREPDKWQFCSPRAARYATRVSSSKQRRDMMHTAIDLLTMGEIASEQAVHLLRVATSLPDSVEPHLRGCDARQLVDLARSDDCVPVRGWARHAAHLLDAEFVRRSTMDTQEIDSLDSFEQRWAMAIADPRRDNWWLEKHREHGHWRITAAWRLAG